MAQAKRREFASGKFGHRMVKTHSAYVSVWRDTHGEQRRSLGQGVVVDDPFERVPDRQDGEEDIRWPDVDGRRNRAYVVQEVAVRQHDALWLPRGS